MANVINGGFKTPYDRAWDEYFSRLNKDAEAKRKPLDKETFKPVDLDPAMFLPGSTGINHIQMFAEMKKRGLVGGW